MEGATRHLETPNGKPLAPRTSLVQASWAIPDRLGDRLVTYAYCGGVPDSPEKLLRLMSIAPVICLGLGLFFVIIYGLAGLILSPLVRVKEKCVMRSHGETNQVWKYTDLECYELQEMEVGKQTVLVFILHQRDGGVVSFEVSPDISEHEIHRAMDGRLSHFPASG